jgi:DNA-directed RNA polymerase specialized sigma24 family protein
MVVWWLSGTASDHQPMIDSAGVGGQWRATCVTMAIVLGLDSDAPARAVGFDRLIEVEYARVLVLMQVVVGEAQRAEELTLDACVSLRRHWRTVSIAERPDVWLRATALRAAIWRDRRARLGEALHLRGRDAQRQPTSPHQGAAVVAALSALSVQQRAAVALQVLEGRSVAEIAEILACRPATAAGYVSAAKYAMAGSLGLSATDPELVGVLRDALHAAAGDDPPDVDAARLAIARLEERHASRRRSRFALAGVGVVVVLLAAGLLNHPWRDDHQGPQPLPAAVSVSGLYGLWRADVANADQSMLVTMTPSSLGGGFTAYPKCGELDGTLAVTSLGGFAAAVDGSGGRCTLRNGTPQAMQWLEQVYRAEPVGPGWTLLDAAGNTVATLSRADIREFPHAIDLLPIRELGHVPALALDERVALTRSSPCRRAPPLRSLPTSSEPGTRRTPRLRSCSSTPTAGTTPPTVGTACAAAGRWTRPVSWPSPVASTSSARMRASGCRTSRSGSTTPTWSAGQRTRCSCTTTPGAWCARCRRPSSRRRRRPVRDGDRARHPAGPDPFGCAEHRGATGRLGP